MKRYLPGERVTSVWSEGEVGRVVGLTDDGMVRVAWPLPHGKGEDVDEVDAGDLTPVGEGRLP